MTGDVGVDEVERAGRHGVEFDHGSFRVQDKRRLAVVRAPAGDQADLGVDGGKAVEVHRPAVEDLEAPRQPLRSVSPFVVTAHAGTIALVA